MTNGMITLATLSLGLMLSLTSHADDCHLQGEIRLTGPTSKICRSGDIHVEAGTRIITGGHNLLIFAVGNLHLPADGAGLEIVSFENTADGEGVAGTITIRAATAFGHLTVHNDSASAEYMSGVVDIAYITTYDYTQNVQVRDNVASLRLDGNVVMK